MGASNTESRIGILIDMMMGKNEIPQVEKAILKVKEQFAQFPKQKTAALGDVGRIVKSQVPQLEKQFRIKKRLANIDIQHERQQDKLFKSYYKGLDKEMALDAKQAKDAKPFVMMDKIGEQLKKSGNIFGRLRTYFGGFRMEMLGVMFAGMQLQRVFGGLFKDMIANYKKIAQESSPLSKALTMLEANFMYLKFSIMEALAPMLVGWIEKFVDWINILTENPDALERIGKAIIGLAIAGTALFVFGQSVLFLSSFFQAIKTLGALFAIGGAGWILSAGLIALKETHLMTTWVDDLKLIGTGMKDVLTGLFTDNNDLVRLGFQEMKVGALAAVWDFFIGLAGGVIKGAVRFGAVMVAAVKAIPAAMKKGFMAALRGQDLDFFETYKESFNEQLGKFQDFEREYIDTAIKDVTFPQRWEDAMLQGYRDAVNKPKIQEAMDELAGMWSTGEISYSDMIKGTEELRKGNIAFLETLKQQKKEVEQTTTSFDTYTASLESAKNAGQVFVGMSVSTMKSLQKKREAGTLSGDLLLALEAAEGKQIKPNVDNTPLEKTNTILGDMVNILSGKDNSVVSGYQKVSDTQVSLFSENSNMAKAYNYQIGLANENITAIDGILTSLNSLNGTNANYYITRHIKTVYEA